jgi:hypothetical protein
MQVDEVSPNVFFFEQKMKNSPIDPDFGGR